MGKTILFGEPMALLIADTTGPLENVEHFTRALSGAEVNVSIGLTRLGHSVEYLTRLGDDPFGHYIAKTLGENQIGISLLSYDPVYRTGIQLKNRVTDGSDPYAPYYRKGSAASHISEKEIDAIDLTDVNLVHITGIPPALSQSARKATFRLMQRAKDKGIEIAGYGEEFDVKLHILTSGKYDENDRSTYNIFHVRVNDCKVSRQCDFDINRIDYGLENKR